MTPRQLFRRYPDASAFRAALDAYWGENGVRPGPNERTTLGACPACRSKGISAGSMTERYPLVIIEADSGWDLSRSCGCSERAILDRLAEPSTSSGGGVRFRSPEEIRSAAPEDIDFLWDGYLARRAVTLLGGKPKSGKSTLGFAIAEAMVAGARSFLGRPLEPGPVVYVSEEDASTVRAKLPPDGTLLRVLTRGDAWPRPSWRALIDAAVAEAERVAAGLLVIDTLTFWSDLKADQEKDAGATDETMQALVEAANAGLAVLLVHHQRKSGGEEGDAFRGSSAITGAVEALVELERVPDAPPGQRRLVAVARWTVPGMLLLDRDAATGAWRVIGEGAGREDAAALGVRGRILQAVPDEQPGATEPELADLVELDRRKVGRPLRELVDEGLIERVGEGKPYQPYSYFRTPPETLPETLPERGGELPLPTLPSPVGGERGVQSFSSPCGGESNGGPPSRTPPRILTDDELVAALKDHFAAVEIEGEAA